MGVWPPPLLTACPQWKPQLELLLDAPNGNALPHQNLASAAAVLSVPCELGGGLVTSASLFLLFGGLLIILIINGVWCGSAGLPCERGGGGGKGHPMGDFAAASFRVGLSEGHVPSAGGFVLEVNCTMLL